MAEQGLAASSRLARHLPQKSPSTLGLCSTHSGAAEIPVCARPPATARPPSRARHWPRRCETLRARERRPDRASPAAIPRWPIIPRANSSRANARCGGLTTTSFMRPAMPCLLRSSIVLICVTSFTAVITIRGRPTSSRRCGEQIAPGCIKRTARASGPSTLSFAQSPDSRRAKRIPGNAAKWTRPLLRGTDWKTLGRRGYPVDRPAHPAGINRQVASWLLLRVPSLDWIGDTRAAAGTHTCNASRAHGTCARRRY